MKSIEIDGLIIHYDEETDNGTLFKVTEAMEERIEELEEWVEDLLEDDEGWKQSKVQEAIELLQELIEE